MSLKEKLMNSASGFTAADLALLAGDTPDLLDRDRPKASLMQPNSPELVQGDKYVKGATAGGFVIPYGEDRIPVPSFTFILLKLEKAFNEYLPGHGSFVTPHVVKPPDAVWKNALRDGVEKTGLVRLNGNSVVETISALILIDVRQPAAFDFYRSALVVGRDLGKKAHRLRVNIDGAEYRSYTLGKWQMSSVLEKDSDHRWFKPVVTPLGKLGEPDGPTIEEWRLAQKLRLSLKAGELDWTPEGIEPPAPPAELPAPPAEWPIARRATSARELRGSRGDRDTPPPVTEYDGPDSEPSYSDLF
jgi:hypothetical protein